jgi:GR25 family glycosyltransferase involved in LPS biosynthesis
MKKILLFIFFITFSVCFIFFIYKHIHNLKIQSSAVVTNKNSAILVIHLDRAVKREQNVEKIYTDLAKISALKNFTKHTIQAVDGQKLTKQQKESHFQKNLIKPYIPDNVQISNNVIACFLSHRKAWQYIVNNNLDSGLIFEDDAQINPQVFSQALQVGFSNLRPNVIIRFKYNEPKAIESLFGTYNDNIYFPLIPSPVTVSYLISNSTAKKLLAMTEKFDRPVDEFLKLTNHTNIYSGEVYPSGIKDISNELGGSTIGYINKDTLWQKIKRETNRLFYRLKLL